MAKQRHHEEVSPQGTSSGAFTSTLLLTSGFGMLALGVALRFATGYSWQLDRLGEQLSAEGISPIFVAFAGFVAFGFGLIHRASHAAAKQLSTINTHSDEPDFGLVATEFAGGLKQVQEAVRGLGHHITLANHEQRTFQETLLKGITEKETASGTDDPLFRLAAGIDKLHEVIDQRIASLAQETTGHNRGLHEQVDTLGKQFQAVQGVLDNVLNTVRSLPAAITSHAAAFGTEPTVKATPVVQAAQVTQAAETPALAPATNPATNPAPSSATTSEATPPSPRDIYNNPPAPEQPGQGGHVAPEEQTIDTDRLVEEGLEVLVQLEEGRPPGAQPATVDEEEFFQNFAQNTGSSAQAATPQPEPPPVLPTATPTKEDTLDSLLPDETLRDALGGS